MSNVGQGLLTITGTIIGGYFGAPQLGYLLGSLAGQALFPTQLPGIQGPKLQDLRTTTAQMGAPVMEVMGVDAVPGTVIWLGPVEEVANREDVGGKGGPEQTVTNFSYFQPIALGLCRGEMGGLVKIFENGKLVYDASPQGDTEDDDTYLARAMAAGAYSETFSLYLGDEAQMPDPTIESVQGVGNVPAFRGLMYIVFHNRELRADQGMRHPNFKFIVYQEGISDCVEVRDYSTERLYPWVEAEEPINLANEHTFFLNSLTINGFYDSLPEAIGVMSADFGHYMGNYLTYSPNRGDQPAGNSYSYTIEMGSLGATEESQLYFFYNYFDAGMHVASNTNYQPCMIYSFPGNDLRIAVNANFGTSARHTVTTYGGPGPAPSDPGTPPDYQSSTADGLGNWIHNSYSGMVTVTRVPSPPTNPCNGLPPYPGAPGYCIIDGFIIQGSEWVHDFAAYNVLQQYGGVTNPVIYPLNPVRPAGHEDNTEEFWTEAYQAAVTDGKMEPGLTYGVDYPILTNQAYYRDYLLCSAEVEGITLDQVVRHICNRCTLRDDQIDVTDLAGIEIVGYVLSRVMNGRDAIEPLRLIGYFDVVESGRQLKFITRGKAAVRTLTGDDLAAHETGSEMPVAITTRKQQDTELPRQLRLHYRAPSRDYEEGEQLSPTRLTTTATNDVDVECPVAITDQMAAEAAEVNWADPWAGRWVHQFELDRSHLDLEPSDCILVPVDGRQERLRILAIDDRLTITRRIEAVRDDDGTYVSVAVSDDPLRPPAVMAVYAGTTLMLLDLPALRDVDNDVGIYAVATPSSAGTWSGASIFRSIDGGSSYESFGGISSAATTITLLEALPAGLTSTWDDEHTILVRLDTGTLESRPDEDVLEGANSLALGADDRWEILQFGVATQVGPTTWELTHLLRGRRGTEHLMGTSVEGDRGVLVSGAGVIRLPLTNSFLNTPVLYRAVTNGTTTASSSDQSFTSEGVALLPFSPVMIEATRELDDDILITWLRRDRLGQELQSGTDVPMSEASLSFEVDIWDGTTQLRTISTSTESAIYTAAQQTTDFGGLAGAFRVEVSQISAVVGRGPVASSPVDV